MQVGSVTTPFGRRPMTLGMLTSHYRAKDIEPNQSVDKWKIFRALCEAKPLLGLSDRALAVLNALLSFYPANELSAAHGLVVFPSNAQLSLRAHGIAPATLRRHLAALVDAGLLVRKDSPNGKRFARRDSEGEVGQAYGFNIAPLIARASEIQLLAAQVTADREHLRATKEQLSLCRRDIAKLVDAAMEEGVPGDWMMVHGYFRQLVTLIPRSPTVTELAPILGQMELLRQKVLNLLEIRINVEIMSANESQGERHIQDSKPESISDLEAASKYETVDFSAAGHRHPVSTLDSATKLPKITTVTNVIGGQIENWPKQRVARTADASLKSFPLGLVLQACPEILAYGPGGNIASWRDLMVAAVVVRSMLGVSDTAYQEACEAMGQENAATVMACVLQRTSSITSAGGYLRDLTRRTIRGEFAVGPMLMALARANSSMTAQSG